MIVLASSSPRRRALLTQAGLAFVVDVPDVDETPLKGESAASCVERLAVEKAQAVCARRRAAGEPALPVVAADTAVVHPDGFLLGKPADAAEARAMLESLAGRTHAVLTGLAVVVAEGQTVSDVEVTQVTLEAIAPAEIAAYVASGEPLDKAGSYAIQGYAARWVSRIEGDYSNVVGLPLARLVRMLGEVLPAEMPRNS